MSRQSTWKAPRIAPLREVELGPSVEPNSVEAKPSRTLLRLQAQLRSSVGKAIADFGMIAAGDRSWCASPAERTPTPCSTS